MCIFTAIAGATGLPLVAGLSLDAMLVGGVAGAAGTMNKSRAQAQVPQYQAAIARNNKQVAEYNAEIEETKKDDVTHRARNEEKQVSRQEKAAKGRQRVTFAASGVDVSDGSPLDVLDTTDLLASEDVYSLRYNASKARYGHDINAYNFRNRGRAQDAQAGLYDLEARNIRKAGKINAATSLLGTATNMIGRLPLSDE